jgi:uncharacterized protein YcbX
MTFLKLFTVSCYCLSTTVSSMTATSTSTSTSTSTTTVKGLYRHAVKGLSADSLDSVTVQALESFPDDRRFALLKTSAGKELLSLFDAENPEWLHKSNFLCAFSAPELMAKYRAHYSLQKSSTITTTGMASSTSFGFPNDQIISTQKDDAGGAITETTKRLLSLYERRASDEKVLLDSVDLSLPEGRQALADFFSNQSGETLTCVTADNFQFGNTSSGVKKKKGNTRTVHIINAATVREVSKAIGVPLNPTRFRPNIVIDGPLLEPWEEFQWIDKSIRCGTCRMDVIQRTVRCDAVSVDPLVFPDDMLDIPALLVKHFPEHGPYLGVYAHVEEGGTIQLGDSVSLLA